MTTADHGAPTVLLVDDHPMWRATLRRVLERRTSATVVAEAEDGRAALRLVEEHEPDVVVMDLDMPEMDGIAATQALAASSSSSVVIVLSASQTHDDVVAAVRAGARGYLPKTAGPDDVVDAITRIHAGELVFPPAVAPAVLEALRSDGDVTATPTRDGSAAAAAPDEAPRRASGPQPEPTALAQFELTGEFWTLTFEGETALVGDLKGMHDIAALLPVPGREVHCLDLVAAREGHAPTRSGVSAAEVSASGLSVTTGSGTGPLLDAQAKAAYRRRIEELQEELREAEDFRDTERAARARAELDALVEQLEQAVGLGGRDRPQKSAAERARINVSRGVSRAIDRIEASHASLGAHLRRAVHTGTFCRYQPDEPVRWSTGRGE